MDKSALYKVGYGLYVLTASDNNKDNGCIINTFMQITSTDVITCIISLNKSNHTHDMIVNTKKFNVSILDDEVKFDIFKRFGLQSGKDVNKFDGIDFAKRSENGIMYIDKNTNAYISCEVSDMIDADTHTIIMAKVTDASVLSDSESLTYAGYHKNVKPQPKQTKKEVKGWRCRICGYIYEGEELPDDFICPVCKHGASDFERI